MIAEIERIAKDAVRKIYTAIALEEYPLDGIIRAAIVQGIELALQQKASAEIITPGRFALLDYGTIPYTSLAPIVFNAMRAGQLAEFKEEMK